MGKVTQTCYISALNFLISFYLPTLEIVALELDQYYKDLATPYFEKAGVGNKVDVRIGSASDALHAMKDNKEESFDLIFIDADKVGYMGYYEAILQNGLLRKGGVMLVDNVLYKVSSRVEEIRY